MKIALFVFLIAALSTGSAVASDKQKILILTETDSKDLTSQRAVIERYLGDETSKQKYQTSTGKLGTLRALLKTKAFKSGQTYELQSMGVVLGDVFVQDLGFHWIMVEDEYGRDPAIQYKETSILLFPLTMISKRVERGEEIDVFEMYNGLAAEAQKLIENESSR